MQTIRNKEFGGERPLYASHDLRLENVTIHIGESSIKESSNIEAEECRFEGKYVFWETRGFRVHKCFFTESARSSLWYSSDCRMTDCKVEACLAEIPMPEHGKNAESFQFMRQGYFCLDNRDAAPGHLVFNRSVALKDSFRK